MIEIVEEKEEKKKKIIKKPLTINESNWNKILGCSNSKQNNAVLPEVIVVKQKEVSGMEEIIAMDSDYQLNSKIERMKCVLNTLGPKLPDKGAKFRKNLQLYEAERDRRVRDRALKEAECGKSTQSQTSDACNGSSSETPSPKDQSQSEFGKLFGKELDKKPNCSTHISVSLLHKGHPQSGGSNHQNTISNGLLSNKRRKESKADSRQSRFKIPRNSSRVGNEHRVSIDSSSFYSPKEDGKFSSNFPKRRKLSQAQPALRSRNKKRETVVLLDEEDCQPEETTQEEDEPVGRMEAKLYYPSRDDPESVELCYSDIKFLAPEAFLSSAIMNFYIRYLQRPVSATGRSRSDYHFFNTFFYGKLKEAVSCKTNDKDLLFSKFRRWWKGVNIFEKSYILLPIHESLHWSLVIICLPNKDDESGPIILHLDSLGYHLSSQIFQNVRSFLKEEWNYLKETNAPTNVPMAERIWKHLPRRIDERIIMVPQQKNDYDCGIFVLYFMERFIEEAPERLRKDDLDMFGRKWFKPEEASRLRGRIRELLKEEFDNPITVNNNGRESSPTSSGDGSPNCTEEEFDNPIIVSNINSRESSPTSSGDGSPKGTNDTIDVEA